MKDCGVEGAMVTGQGNEAVPVLVVGYSRDGSGDRVLAMAADLGRRLRAQLLVVHVLELKDFPVDADAADWEEQGWQAVGEERGHVAEVLDGDCVSWEFETRRGDPAVELVRAADEHGASMIVVGTRGEGLHAVLPRLFEPSVSHGVIGHQDRPVLVVPADAKNEAGDTGSV